MSTKEVSRRWKITSSLRETEIIIGPATFEQVEVMPVDDHLAAMAEKDAEIERLKQHKAHTRCPECGNQGVYSNGVALLDELAEAREMIDGLKKILFSHSEHWPKEYRWQFVSDMEKKIAELEQKAGAKDE
jgi:hypothetical protein